MIDYKSPIEIFHSEMEMQMEGEVLKACQRVGVQVDKEELIKALQYDRGQYEKGYQDGLNADKWIPVEERLPNKEEYIKSNGKFIVTDGNRVMVLHFDVYETKQFGVPQINGFCVNEMIVYWQPLPQPYKKEGGTSE